MRIIQTFWSKNFNGNDYRSGWLSSESNIMCWALSCLNAKSIYGNIELYTDRIGFELLINKFCLPYDKVHIVFDDNDFMTSLPKELWALSKVYTYSLQNEPFIHIDGDFIFWFKIDIKKNIIFQNLEIELDFYKDIYEVISKEKKNFNSCNFTKCIYKPFSNNAANLGIFGGYEVSFIKRYANDIIEFFYLNKEHKDLFIKYSKNMNCFLEQYYFFFLVKENDMSFNTIHPNFFPVPEKNKSLFFNIPSADTPFNHFLGNSKKVEIVNDFIKRKLFEFYPSYYSKIKSFFSNNNCFDFCYFNKLNNSLCVNSINTSFIENLFRSNLKMSEVLIRESIDFWGFKKELLQKCKNHTEEMSMLDEPKIIINSYENFSIRLNENFITIKKYSLPWDKLFLSDKFFNADINKNGLHEISEESIKNPPVYCVFSYTPFESSISSFWLPNLQAYILSRVLNEQFQSISEIILKMNTLLKDESKNSYQRLKSILLIFLKEISSYGIIEVKN